MNEARRGLTPRTDAGPDRDLRLRCDAEHLNVKWQKGHHERETCKNESGGNRDGELVVLPLAGWKSEGKAGGSRFTQSELI